VFASNGVFGLILKVVCTEAHILA